MFVQTPDPGTPSIDVGVWLDILPRLVQDGWVFAAAILGVIVLGIARGHVKVGKGAEEAQAAREDRAAHIADLKQQAADWQAAHSRSETVREELKELLKEIAGAVAPPAGQIGYPHAPAPSYPPSPGDGGGARYAPGPGAAGTQPLYGGGQGGYRAG